LAAERGFTMIEVLIAASLMVVVLTAALTTFDGLLSGQSTASTRFDAQDRARMALDRLARDLRNVSGAATGLTEIDVSNSYELIFRTTNPAGPPYLQNSTNLERVRYCIDQSNPANHTLRVMTQTWGTTSVPNVPSLQAECKSSASISCAADGTTWCGNTVYVDHVTNEVNNQTRPLFSYTSQNGAIVAVHTDLFINGVATTTSATNSRASETELSSGVFLRNQDVPPSAAFTATAGVGYITLDGSASSDPNGQPLTYVWYDGTTKLGSSNSNSPGATSGIVFTYNKDAKGNTLSSNTAYTVSLKVYDPAGLEGDAPAQTVTVK
jgi:prepilin-type N-terminal cleavage/methylation domain-containing protein